MQTITPKRAESIRDVVAPQRFDSVELWLELPADAKATERFFYENLLIWWVVQGLGVGVIQH